jgi:hypothetical protein
VLALRIRWTDNSVRGDDQDHPVPFGRELSYRSAGQKRFVVGMCVQANDRGHKSIVAGLKRWAIQDANNEP